jgi:hypothetical protein
MEAKTWCPICGPGLPIDEDGCCTSCGSTATGEGSDEALAVLAELESLRAERDEACAEVERLQSGQEVVEACAEARRQAERAERLEKVLRTMLRSAVPNPKEHPTMWAAWGQAREALAPSAPEPAPAPTDPVAVRMRCDAAGLWCRACEHDSVCQAYPAPAATERVCRHDRYVGGICDSCGGPWGGHDRACHEEQG